MKARWILATVCIAALGLAACSSDQAANRGDDDDGGARNSTSDATPSGESGLTVASSSAKGDTSTGGGDEPLPALDPTRKIIFTATLSLRADDVSRTYVTAVDLARQNGGYLEKSQFTNDDREDNSRRTASLTIRVPVANYNALLESLRTVNGASVETEGSSSNEVTDQYTDMQSRLRNLERTESRYLELMAQAKTIQDILTVQDRLSSVRSQIEQIQGRLNVLDHQSELATVNVTISPVAAKPHETPRERWTLSEVAAESWERSIEAARYVAAGAVIAAVAGAWLVVPLGLVAVALRFFRRRPQGVTGA